MERPNNVIQIDTTLSDFFKHWFEYLAPIHHLTAKQSEVMAAFIELRYELGKVISDETLLDETIMNEKYKRIIREKCGMSLQYFLVIMGELRKKKVIKNNKIDALLIPRLKPDGKDFKLLLYFPIHD